MPKKLTDYIAVRGDRTEVIRKYLLHLGDHYVDQLELCKATGTAFNRLGGYRETFAAHVVPARNASGKPTFLWAGTAKLAKEMRAVK